MIVLLVGMDYVSIYAINLHSMNIDYIDKVESKIGCVGTYAPFSTLAKSSKMSYSLFIGQNGRLSVFKLRFDLEKSASEMGSENGQKVWSLRDEGSQAPSIAHCGELNPHKHIDLRNSQTIAPTLRANNKKQSINGIEFGQPMAPNNSHHMFMKAASLFRVRPEAFKDLALEQQKKLLSKTSHIQSGSVQGEDNRSNRGRSVLPDHVSPLISLNPKQSYNTVTQAKLKLPLEDTVMNPKLDMPSPGLGARRMSDPRSRITEEMKSSRNHRVHYTINVQGDKIQPSSRDLALIQSKRILGANQNDMEADVNNSVDSIDPVNTQQALNFRMGQRLNVMPEPALKSRSIDPQKPQANRSDIDIEPGKLGDVQKDKKKQSAVSTRVISSTQIPVGSLGEVNTKSRDNKRSTNGGTTQRGTTQKGTTSVPDQPPKPNTQEGLPLPRPKSKESSPMIETNNLRRIREDVNVTPKSKFGQVGGQTNQE